VPDFYGLLQVPAPAAVNAATDSAGDPMLAVLADFLQSALNADLSALWAPLSPMAPVPVANIFTFNPKRSAFSESKLPALFVWREADTKYSSWTQSYDKAVSNINALWLPPRANDAQTSVREPFSNAVAKSVARNISRGRNPAWVVSGDTEAKAADYGSLLITHIAVVRILSLSAKLEKLSVEDSITRLKDPLDGMLSSIEVWEALTRGTGDYFPQANVQGAISVGKNADGLNAIPILSYQFQPTLISVAPATGSSAGGTPITLKGRQFYRLDAAGHNTTDPALLRCVDATLATTEGIALQNVAFVDEGTFTATMPARPAGAGAGVVGLVMAMPNGNTATLANAFTYA
jgi:hypothetical protein